MFSIRVEEKATADADSATGTSRLAPCPRFGTMILYGTSYLRVSAQGGQRKEAVRNKQPQSHQSMQTVGVHLSESRCSPVAASVLLREHRDRGPEVSLQHHLVRHRGVSSGDRVLSERNGERRVCVSAARSTSARASDANSSMIVQAHLSRHVLIVRPVRNADRIALAARVPDVELRHHVVATSR